MASQSSLKAKQRDNQLELLLFHIGTAQRFGINVLKVDEVIPCPSLTKFPDSHVAVRGVAHLRGETISVVDLSMAMGRGPLGMECGTAAGDRQGSIIVTEINRQKQGFLVERVDRIIVKDWKDILPPPRGLGANSYASGVTKEEDSLVQILDVERVMGEVNPDFVDVGEEVVKGLSDELRQQRILVVDDSSMARNQTAKTLDQLQLTYDMARDGKEALAMLRENQAGNDPETNEIALVVSDIEMPEMDGYSLTREIRRDPELSNTYVLLHTSLNGAINTQKAKQCKADDFLTKFVSNDLAQAVVKGLQKRLSDRS
jgi:two-component system chemotaxis response regulator CheV